MGDLTLANNIWCDASDKMPRFSIGKAELFAPDSEQVLDNNLYWNGGKAIPTKPEDALTPDRDARKIMADPRLGNPNEGLVLPRWNADQGQFLSGRTTIRGEFERLVTLYALPGADRATIEAADPAMMPESDILGNPRGPRPDLGCFERYGTP
jgi:hypothetical protein